MVCIAAEAPIGSEYRVVIEDDAEIGTGAILLGNETDGLRIGRRSIVGAGSVVTKSIPPNQIWAGCPAKFLRDRP